MQRVVRRYLTRDPSGRAISVRSERLTDDGQGAVHFSFEQAADVCSGCHRPIVDLAELRGTCDYCQDRGCCVQCESRCQICSRRLCGRCRRGFAGHTPMTVCVSCLQLAVNRQALEDRLRMQQLFLEREVAERREQHQIEASHLAIQRFEFDSQMQMARLRLAAGLPIVPQAGLLRRICSRMIQYVPRLLR